jgi:peptide/nickel transport system permease protein
VEAEARASGEEPALAQPPAALTMLLERAPRLGLLTWFSLVILLVLLATVLIPGVLATGDPIALNVPERLQAPSLAHPFGTDEGGRDIYSRVVYGARASLGIAVVVVVTATVFGTLYGAVSGLLGGTIDEVMMRIVDLFLAFPAFVLALAVSAALGRGLSSVAIALAIIWWPGYARLVRGEVLSLREYPHVETARSLGVSGLALVRKHMLPFMTKDVNVRMTTDIAYALVAVTAMSFLGLGAQSPTPEWGLLIRDSRNYFGSAWWYLFFPGMMVMITALAFSLLGDAIAERGDR